MMEIILAYLFGALCGAFCTALANSADKRDGYDDYYDHDVSGLLEDD